MRVLVTGVAGRVGSWLAEGLVRSGYDVRGTVRPGGRKLHEPWASKVDVVEADLTDNKAIQRATAGVDTVVHLAVQMPLLDTPIDRYFDINVGGTLRLLEAATNQETPVRRFIHVSTDNTYGPAHPQSDPITEEHPQFPGDYYGTSKVLCEHLVWNFHKIHDLEYSIIRLGSIVTPEEAQKLFRLGWVQAFFTKHANAGSRSNLWQLFRQCDDPLSILEETVGPREDNPAVALTGPGGKPWSIHFTDVRDVVAGIALAIKHADAANQSFNVFGPRSTNFEEGATVAAKHFETDILPVEMPMTLAFALSNAKASRMLGYTPQWTFDQILEESPVAHRL